MEEAFMRENGSRNRLLVDTAAFQEYRVTIQNQSCLP